MKIVKISEEVKKTLPDLKLGCISSLVDYKGKDNELWKLLEEESKKIKKYTTEEIKQIPQIKSTREAYKKLGKEPSRYRPSSEALMRRLVRGKGMYQISNIVDAINFASIKTGYSIGGYDADKIKGDIILAKGTADAEYYAIGRGLFNVENLPVFFDEIGPFGSPTSDSERTKIDSNTKNIFLIVLNFGNHKNFENDLKIISDLIKKYCNGRNIKTEIIKK